MASMVGSEGERMSSAVLPEGQQTAVIRSMCQTGAQAAVPATVTNIGGTALAGFQVTDTLPAGLTLVGMSGGPSWTCLLNACTYTVPLLPGATTPAITVTVDVAPDATSPQVNVASVTVPPGDPTPFNNTVNDPTTIVDAPDLVIQKVTASSFSPAFFSTSSAITSACLSAPR